MIVIVKPQLHIFKTVVTVYKFNEYETTNNSARYKY